MRYRAQHQRFCLHTERLEKRELLAADIGGYVHATEHGHGHDHDDEHIEYWLPTMRPLALPFSTPLSTTVETEEWQQLLRADGISLVSDSKTTSDYRVTNERFDDELGVRLIYLQQTFYDFDIVNANANLAIAADGELISGYSSFVDAKASSEQQFVSISPEMALASLADVFEWEYTAAGSLVPAQTKLGNKTYSAIEAPSIASAPVAYESVFVPAANGSLIPAWRLNVQARNSNDWLDASVSAIDGSVLFVANWSSHAQYNVFALPKESPSEGGRTLLTDPHNISQSPFGWHDTNGVAGAEFTITRGNNTYAYRDTDNNNLPDTGSSPSGGASLVFNPSLDLTQPPAASADASTVNLFYVTNVLHDVLGIKGFNAASGNFQVNNYGAGGLGNDPLLAEDFDGGGFNNANMATPPDGTSPRMQMYLWNLTTPQRSGSFDNGIIAHEYAHGLTNRLTGGAANSSALTAIQSRGMGEGWSDYFALAFTQQASDTAVKPRGIGTYALGQPTTGAGIRTQRYSYDMSINSRIYSDITGSTSVHFVGETWAATLWDLHWALINGNALDPALPQPGLGFNGNLYANSGGNNVAMRLIAQALKLQPANPTFLQARDAILAADRQLYSGANQATIWTVFARRGMGIDANDGGAATSTNVTNGFELPIISTINYQRLGLLGSAIASIDSTMLPIVTAGGNQRVSFAAEAGSKTSFVITPSNSAATLTVQILRATGGSARGATSSPTPGSPVIIPPWGLAAGGQFILSVTSDQPTGIQLKSARSAALEAQIGDSNFDNELGIEGSSRIFSRGTTLGVVGSSDAGQRMVKRNSPSSFVDISTTGTPLNLSDDGNVSIVTTVGNSLFPAGSVIVGNNGGILAGSSGVVSFSNQALVAKASSVYELYPFWDDIDSDTGNVYWEERNVGGIQTLIVQWHNRPHFSNIGSGTFQLQLFATGPVLARFAYADVNFGSSSFDFGQSATIGAISAGIPYQFSFNSPVVADGDVIDFTNAEDIDEYRFTAVAGERLDVALDALGTTEIGTTFMRILSESNQVLATANTKPISTQTTVSNYDLGRVDFIVPSTGIYSVRVYGRTRFDYYLSVTKNLTLDTENSSGNITPNRLMPLPGAMIGYLDSMDTRDVNDFQLQAGQTVTVTLTRVGSTPGNVPLTDLAPRLTLLRPNFSGARTTNSFNAAGEMILTYTAVESGRHRVDVRREAGSGEYHVRIEQASPALISPAPAIAEVPIESTSLFKMSSWQNQFEPLDTNGDGLVTPVDALLLIDELNSRRLSGADGRFLKPTPDSGAVDALLDVNGDELITPLDALMVIDRLNRS